MLLAAARAMEETGENELSYEMEILSARIGGERSLEKQLLFYKLIEHVAAYSQREAVWRPAMGILSDAMIPEDGAGIVVIGSLERETVCAHCVKQIYEKCAAENRKALAFDILAEALFSYEDRLMWKIFTCIERADRPTALATMVAFAAKEGLPPKMRPALLDSLHRHGRLICENGGAQAIAFAQGRLEGEGSGIEGALLEGFRDILNARGAKLPHPAYLERPSGFPIPRFIEGGRQLSSFRALGRMRSGNALRVIIGGIHQLVVPHVELDAKGDVQGELTVVRAMGEISDALANSLRLCGVRSAEEFTNAVLSRPEPRSFEQLDRITVRRIGHLLYEFGRLAEFSGTQRYPVSSRATMGLVLAVLSGTDGRGSIYPWKLAAANVALISREYRKTFGSEGIIDDGKRVEFLAKMAKEKLSARPKTECIALPPKFEKGTAQKIEKK
jgi:hypothetical protein